MCVRRGGRRRGRPAVADRLRNLMLRCAALLLVLALLGLPAGGWVLPPPSPSPPPFDGPLAGLPEPDLQNRRCGQSCGANDTTSAMCQGSTVDGRLSLSFAEVQARCAADTACVGFGQFSGSYFRPVTFFTSLDDHSHPGQWKTWSRSGYKPAPAPPHPTPPPPPHPPPPPTPPPPPPPTPAPTPPPPGPPRPPACPWISGSQRPCPCPKLPCNPQGHLQPFCGVCTCTCTVFTNASCCNNGHNGVFGGCVWVQSDSKCSPKPPAPHKPMLENPCTPGYVAAKTSFCDHTLSPERRLDDAIARIPLEEKFGMLGTAGLCEPIITAQTVAPALPRCPLFLTVQWCVHLACRTRRQGHARWWLEDAEHERLPVVERGDPRRLSLLWRAGRDPWQGHDDRVYDELSLPDHYRYELQSQPMARHWRADRARGTRCNERGKRLFDLLDPSR
jgi:hypothetical protein